MRRIVSELVLDGASVSVSVSGGSSESVSGGGSIGSDIPRARSSRVKCVVLGIVNSFYLAVGVEKKVERRDTLGQCQQDCRVFA
jgi:hypothetical protein